MIIKKLSKIAFLSRCKIKLSNCTWVVISSLKDTHNRFFTRMNMSAFFLRIVDDVQFMLLSSGVLACNIALLR